MTGRMIEVEIVNRTGPLRLALPAALVAGVVSVFAFAQPVKAQEVVQALPPREAGQLNAALRRLASRPADLEALVSAGNASLGLNDAGAAAGFFARAARVAPADGRVMLGLARVALAQRRPVEALQGFAQAERAGIRGLDMAVDRALAYDLVGDNAAAQALYRSMLAAGDDPAVRLRLAISLAIAGDRMEFERVLYPLLRQEDRAAYRTRAFGLAIMGRTDDAVAIADAMMPTDLALRMAPYLRYMPRLTRAQQAAAANLGAFPPATEIGRDSPDIAGYAAAGTRIAARADASLTPAGPPLGAAVPPRARTARAVAIPAPAATSPARIARAELPPARAVAIPAMPAVSSPPPAPRPVAAPEPARPDLFEVFSDLGPASTARPAAPGGAVDITAIKPAREAPPAAAAKPVARVPEAKPAPKPAPRAKPAEPSRIWVQVATGRRLDALAFDWRRFARQAGGALDGKGPFSARWGAANRLLAGPYASAAAARAAIKRLKDKGVDGAFVFTSEAGEAVSKLD